MNNVNKANVCQGYPTAASRADGSANPTSETDRSALRINWEDRMTNGRRVTFYRSDGSEFTAKAFCLRPTDAVPCGFFTEGGQVILFKNEHEGPFLVLGTKENVFLEKPTELTRSAD